MRLLESAFVHLERQVPGMIVGTHGDFSVRRLVLSAAVGLPERAPLCPEAQCPVSMRGPTSE